MAELGDGPFQIAPVQFQPPGAAAQRALSFRAAMLQQQQGQQALREGAIGLQEKQQQLRDQQIIQGMYADRAAAAAQQQQPAQNLVPGASGAPTLTGAVVGAPVQPQAQPAAAQAPIGDLDLAAGAQRGLSGAALQQLQQQQLANQTKRAEAAKDNAQAGQDVSKTQLETMQKIAQISGGLIANVAPANRAAAWPEARARAIASGAPDDPRLLPIDYPGDAWLAQQHDSGMTAIEQATAKLAASKDAREQELQPATLLKANSDAASANIDAKSKQVDGLTPEQRGNLAARNKSVAIEGQNAAVNAGRLSVEKQRLGFDTNGGVSTTAQMIARGSLDPQTTRAMLRNNPGLMDQVQKASQSLLGTPFDEATIDNRYNTLKEFTNTSIGKAGGQAVALNTLIHHADLYMETADALKNGSFKPGNAVYNAVADAFGKAPPTNAALVGRFFASETGKVATGGVPAEGEINGILKNLGTNAGPEQIAGAGKTLLGIAGGRAVPLMERAKQAKIDGIVQVLGPSAKEALKRRGFDPDTMKPADGTAAPAAKTNPYR